MRKYGLLILLFFTTLHPQSNPVISYPSGGTSVYENPVSLIWYINGNSTGFKYNVQISFYPDFHSIFLNVADHQSTSYNFTTAPGIHYYWRVRSSFNNNYSGWAQSDFYSAGTPQTFSITAAAHGSGNISPSGTVQVNQYSSQQFSFSPNGNYRLDSLFIDGIRNYDSASTYTFTGVNAPHSINAYFGIIKNPVISSAGSGGSISPSGTSSVNYGDSLTFTITPDTGYHISQVIVDGINAGVVNSYTFHNVTSAHTIHVNFAIDTFTILANATGGGTISPAGIISANWGDNKTFNISCDSLHRYLRLIVDGDTISNTPPTYTFTNIRENHSITAEFRSVITIYVSTTGADTGSGTISNPLRTVSAAIQRTYAEQVYILDGLFDYGNDNLGVVIFNNIRPELTVTGSGLTFVRKLTIGGNNIHIKNIRVDSYGNGGTGILLADINNVSLENIYVNDFAYGVQQTNQFIYQISNLTVNNISFTRISNFGIQLLGGSNYHFNNISMSNPFGFGINPIGLLLQDVTNSSFDNLWIVNFTAKGIWMLSGNNVSFHNGYINNSEKGISLEPMIGGNYILPGISNVSFTGNYEVRQSQFSIYLSSLNPSYSIFNTSFNGKIKTRLSVNPAVILNENVIGTYFNGLDIDSCSSGIIISGSHSLGTVIRNSSFKVSNAINLINNPFDVDARFNDFPLATSFMQIHAFIVDKFSNPALGLVDFTGSTWGMNPNITVQEITNAYKGASYYISIDLDKKTTDYNFISGAFTYDTSKVQYLSYLSTGIINDKNWYLNVNGSVPGIVTFAGYGIDPIDADGTLLQLYMKVKETAPDFSAVIHGEPMQFIGNSHVGEFMINDGTIHYTAPSGTLQAKGDVTLDGVVNMSDFFALLFHLSGTVIITNPTALLNADFNEDGTVDINDLNALFAFINGGPVTMPYGSGKIVLANSTYNGTTSVKIPVVLNNSHNVRSLDLTLTYDPAVINFQSFSKQLNIQGYSLIAFESSAGKTKFVFNSVDNIQNNFTAGELVLRFPTGSVPVGARINTSFQINGQQILAGPSLILNAGGVLTEVNPNINNLPTDYTLYQNYPNPFNPSTTIRYDLPKASYVSIKIFDILGKEVKSLVNGQNEAGSHSVQWNGDDNFGSKISSGVYLYMIKAGDFVSTRKMVIMK